MGFFPQLIAWINIPANFFGDFLLAPVFALPGWLSNTIISAVTGVILLITFKYTSNQAALGRIRDGINANILVLWLFKDSLLVTLKSLGRIFKGAFVSLVHSIRPILVIIIPVCLLLGQMGLWYQYRPLKPGEHAVITMKLSGDEYSAWPELGIDPMPAAEIETGPVRVSSKREVYWDIKVNRNGYQRIMFKVDDQRIEKELAVGDGIMRVSARRPGWDWSDILMYPLEKPFAPDSLVQSISIGYPARVSLTSGADWWIVYFFVISLVVALIFKPVFKVRI
ncbi:conserved membrane hypothetical protein [uncultured Desulfobacterium sp.]|uniref:Uncharacterized protein n=1 Tax=uncultured Desulfobacterium sp. TaxID=201089 RepID=A0A445MUH6_9BACT|nr:conserved membrane hypothetical protein [uncultured Desulfobacterium sp.]